MIYGSTRQVAHIQPSQSAQWAHELFHIFFFNLIFFSLIAIMRKPKSELCWTVGPMNAPLSHSVSEVMSQEN